MSLKKAGRPRKQASKAEEINVDEGPVHVVRRPLGDPGHQVFDDFDDEVCRGDPAEHPDLPGARYRPDSLAEDANVLIRVRDPERTPLAASGVMISPTLMLTNRHIVHSADNDLSNTPKMCEGDGEPELVGGQIFKWTSIHEEDLALVRLDRETEGVEPLSKTR